MSTRTLSILAAGLLLASAPAAHAQGRDPAGAEKLYDEGAKLLAAEDWAGACARFDQSFALDPAPGTMLNLASCAEHEGKLALAWSRLRDARSLNADTGSEARRAEIERFIAAAITRIEPRIPQLTVRVTGATEGVVVKRDGQPTAIGSALPVDPGPHILEVEAPGRETTRKEITLAEGAKEEVVLELGAERASPPPAANEPPPPSSEPPPSREGGLSGLQIGGIVVGGLGVATLGISLVTGLVASGKQSDLEALQCPEGADGTLRCPEATRQEGQDLTQSGSTMAGVSTATTFIGAALVGTGIVLLLVGGDDGAPATTAWAPQLGPDGAGLTYRGGF